MTIRELLQVADARREYIMEDAELTERTNGVFKCLVLFFIDAKGKEHYDQGFNAKAINGVFAMISDSEVLGTIPNTTLDTTIEELFNYTYDWYGIERGLN